MAGAVRTPKMLSRRHRIYRTSVSRRFSSLLKIGGKNVRVHDENMHCFEKCLLTVLAVWLEEEQWLVCHKICDLWSILLIKSDLKWCIHLSRSLYLYLYTIAIILCLEKWFIKVKRKKCITFLCCVMDHFVWCLAVHH